MKTNVFARMLVFALVVVVVAGCVQATPKVQVVEKTVVVEKLITPVPKPIKNLTVVNVPLGWLNNDEFVALQVAQAKGYYEESGLDVNLISGGGSTGFDPIVAINGFDDAVRIGVPAALSLVLKAYAEGIDVVVLAALTEKEPVGFLTIIKDGRRAQSPCDFKGRVVSMQTEATWYVDALGSMCESGPLVSGVDFTVIPAGWTPDCLESGQCDFYCGWFTNQPFVFVQKGMTEGVDYEMFLASDFLPFYYADVIVTTKDYLNRNPEIVKAFVQASIEGLKYVVENPDEAIQIAGLVPGVDRAHAAWRIPVQNQLVGTQPGYIDPVKVQAMIDFLYENGQISRTFDANEVINNTFLP